MLLVPMGAGQEQRKTETDDDWYFHATMHSKFVSTDSSITVFCYAPCGI